MFSLNKLKKKNIIKAIRNGKNNKAYCYDEIGNELF
jgi:hypothetical protein